MSDDKPPSHTNNKSLIDRLTQLITGEPKDQDALIDILREAKTKHLLDHEAFSMIQGVLQFSDMRVRDVMVPRIQMNVLGQDEKLTDILQVVVELGHSRYPVIEDDRSTVVGVLLAKDLLSHIIEDKQQTVKDVMRPVSMVPESKRLNVLLKEFRTEKKHIAIVVDEYGMAAGLVTIEDVLEQIVGEIEDEHDSEEEDYIKQNSANKYMVKAITPITEFNEYFSVKLQDDEHETIGGFVVHQLGHMGKKGDKLEYKQFRFEIIHADNRRVHLLKLKIIEPNNTDKE